MCMTGSIYVDSEGGSLGDLLADQRRTGMRLTANDLAQILMQVAQGLKYIHAQGLVHMDIKPGDLLFFHCMCDLFMTYNLNVMDLHVMMGHQMFDKCAS